MLLVKDRLKEPFLVINADIITNMNLKKLEKFHLKNKADLTVVTKRVQMPLHYSILEIGLI